MTYEYEILPHSRAPVDGWCLRLLAQGLEVGGGIFPLAPEDPQIGATWWNDLTPDMRGHWLRMADQFPAADARRAYRLSQLYDEAETTAYEWLDTRIA